MLKDAPPIETPTALITGAARRIGAVIACRLHHAGYRVWLHCHQSMAAAQALAEQLNQQRADSARCVAADLSDIAALPSWLEQTLAHWGRLDVLVNNASAFYPTPFGQVTLQQWQQLLDTNLTAPFFLCQAAAPWLQQSQGSIVNLVDIHAEHGLPGYAPYSISKAGLVSLTYCLAKELAPNVRVNAIAPGAILWPEHGDGDTSAQATVLERIPLARAGQPEDIAAAVQYFASASYVTGQVLSIDGGRRLFY